MKKIFIFILFFIFVPFSYSYNLEISTDKNDVNINDTFMLTFKLSDAQNVDLRNFLKNVDFEHISKNFEIYWPYQEHRSMMNIVKDQNWKVYEKMENIIILSYELKPKKIWNFSIWPFVFFDWNKKIEKQKIDLKVEKIEKNLDLENISNVKYHFPKKTNFIENIFYPLIFWALLWVIFFFIFNFLKNDKNNKKFLEKSEIKLLENNLENKTEQSLEQILNNLEDKLKENISKKYNFDYKNYSFWEIIEKIENLEDKKNLEEIKNFLDKVKYGNFKI